MSESYSGENRHVYHLWDTLLCEQMLESIKRTRSEEKAHDMRFIHVADLHIGKIVNGFSMIEDQKHVLNEILRLAHESHAQALVIAGDFYDKSTPSAEAVSLVDKFLTDAVRIGLKVIAVSGNHDSSERIAYASEILRSQGVAVSPVYDGKISSYPIEDVHGIVRFWLMPFMKPANVRPYFPEEEIGSDYTTAIACALSTCAFDESERHVLVAHQFVTSGSTKPDLSDSEVSIGGLDNVDASVFKPFSYVALGHIHRAQRIGCDSIRYSGSPLKYSYSEIAHAKSATLVEIDAEGKARYELLPLKPMRDLREIKGPLQELISDEIADSANANDYVRVILTDEHPAIDALARIRSVYPNVMGIEYENSWTRTQTQAAVTSCEVEKIDPLELFARFYEVQNGCELTSEQAQLARQAYSQASESKAGTAL